ncbi:MAG TPA: pyridoxamine 5'-phosphate oxidase [Mycobacteriales bacterium]
MNEVPVHRGDLAPTWRAELDRWVAEVEAAGVPEPTAMQLATADADGRPSVRTVLRKGIDDRGIVFFTNRDSRKGRELAANPRAALCLAYLTLHRQVCVVGDVEEVTREETVAYATSRPRGSQVSAWASRQSQPVESRGVLEATWRELDERFGPDGPVPVPEFWGGFRVLPVTVEFWWGRRDRLHDRLRFRRADGRPGTAGDGGWVLERLNP